MEHVGGNSSQETNTPEVLDFLYRDLGRVASLYAQLFQGDLIGIRMEKIERTVKTSSMRIMPKVAEWGRGSESNDAQVTARHIEPHDYKALLLLHSLELEPLDQPLDTVQTGQLVLVKGAIAIRNYEAVKGLFDRLAKSPVLGLLPDAKLEGLSRKQTERVLPVLVGCLPGGLELEAFTDLGESLVGPLKAEYLSETPDDLLRTYGTALPGTWFVLGIFQRLEADRPSIARGQLIAELDAITDAFRMMYSQGLKYGIQPILVFQKVRWG